MSVIREKIQEAFEDLERGKIEDFVWKISNTADRSVRSATHWNVFRDELEKQLKSMDRKKIFSKEILKKMCVEAL